MRPFALPVALAAVLLLAAPVARASECKVEVGPNDRVTRGETLVIRSGERVDNAVALHGDLVVEGGAVVEKVVAVGGSVTLRSGAEVRQEAVALGGDLVVESGARVGKDAVSLGGQVREARGAKIRGSVVGLAFQGGKSSLAREILKAVTDLDECSVIQKVATGG